MHCCNCKHFAIWELWSNGYIYYLCKLDGSKNILTQNSKCDKFENK